jgi:uncharacterized membrane protein YkoI
VRAAASSPDPGGAPRAIWRVKLFAFSVMLGVLRFLRCAAVLRAINMVLTPVRTRRDAAALAALLALLALSAAFADDDDARLARRLLADGAILPLSYFIEKARSIHDGILIDAELEFEAEHQVYVYELHMLDAAGAVWELEFDAAAGTLLDHEHADD